ncbi:MAG: tripartite tricarboxylate transporter substrate binding protein [Hyphomicrobiales bacterium]|nr:MAG: tripartite tricarboxylate transporter substrate binding protein [Hyphomicrobiales bacterium]
MHFNLKHALIAAVAAFSFTAPAMAQDDYPNKPVRLVIPYGPQGDSNMIGRLMADELTRLLGQTVFVENIEGGGTAIGTASAKNSAADGYTLLFTSHQIVSSWATLKDAGYTPEDFVALGLITSDANVLTIPAAIPATNLAEFVAYAKEQNGALSYGAISPGANGAVLSNMLAAAGDFEWTYIPFEGDQESLLGLMRGEIHGFFGSASMPVAKDTTDNTLPQVTFLAYAGLERSKYLPDVPTFTELGYPQISLGAWTGLFAPKGTPQPIVDKLRAAVDELKKSERLINAIDTMKSEMFNGTIEEFEQLIAARMDIMTKYMEENNIPKR